MIINTVQVCLQPISRMLLAIEAKASGLRLDSKKHSGE